MSARKKSAVSAGAMLLLTVVFACSDRAHFDAAREVPQGFYVAPDGDDARAGTVEEPFATLEAARDAVRSFKEDIGLPDGGITVYLREGVYERQSAFYLDNRDSGEESSPVVYRAYPDEKVVLTGGRIISASSLKPLEDAGLYKMELNKYGISDYGPKELHINGQRMSMVEEYEELQRPGQHYVDTDSGALYFYPDRDLHENDDIKFSKLADHMITLKDVSNVVIKDITLDTGRAGAISCNVFWAKRDGQVLQEHSEKVRADSEVVAGRDNSPYLQHNILLKNLTLRNFRGSGISLHGRNNRIEGCYIHNMGGKGVNLGGGNLQTLERAGNILQNTRIYDTSNVSVGLGWGAAIDVAGVGQIVRNNLIEVTSTPEGYNVGATVVRGAEHLFEYNEFARIFKDPTDDCGIIYFNLSQGPHNRGNVIRRNFFHSIGETKGRQSAIYPDWCSQDILIEENIFYRIGGPDQDENWKAGVMNNASNYVHTVNNIFIDCSIPYRMSYWLSTWGGEEQINRLINARDSLFSEYDFSAMPHGENYPELLDLKEKTPEEAWIYPSQNTFKRNLIYNPNIELRDGWRFEERGFFPVSEDDIEGKDPNELWEGRIRGNWMAEKDPGFRNFEEKDFGLKEDAMVFDMIEGFQAIPFDKIGPQ